MRSFTLILLTCAFAVVGLGAEPAPKPSLASDAALTHLLAGNWNLRIDAKEKVMVSASFTFGSDGKFTSEGVVRMSGVLVKMTVDGKWRIADGVLIEEITKSSHPDIISSGEVTKDQILLLEGNALETRTEEGDIERFERAKA